MERLPYPSMSTPALFLVLYKMFSRSIDDESFRIFWDFALLTFLSVMCFSICCRFVALASEGK